MALLSPQYHIRAAENWINDPNGPIYWDGSYHVFFQRHASSTDWGPTTWGHAVSSDLARWTVLADAFGPTPGSHDADGAWSGTTIAADGQVHAFYTAMCKGREVVASASSSGDLTRWSKAPLPILDFPPLGEASSGWRDPFVFRGDEEWLCLIGSGTRGEAGAALLYRSADLATWEYLGPVCDETPVTSDAPMGEMWECPMLFDLGARHVLGVSAWQDGKQLQSFAMLGSYADYLFVPESVELIDYGPAFYAPSATRGPDGRVLMWGWSWDLLRRGPRQEQGIAGALTLPRVLTVDALGRLSVDPVDEITQLRGELIGESAGQHTLQSASAWPVDEQWDLDLEIESGEIVMALREGESGSELRVQVDVQLGRVAVTTTYSKLDDGRARVGDFEIPLVPGDPVRLRILADGSLFEVYANGKSGTTRFYPGGSSRRIVAVFSESLGELSRAQLWKMEAGLSFELGHYSTIG